MQKKIGYAGESMIWFNKIKLWLSIRATKWTFADSENCMQGHAHAPFWHFNTKYIAHL